MTDWNNLYKIRLNNYTDAFMKHEVVKLLIVKNLLLKYKKDKRYQEIYTEYKLNGKTPDVAHINNKSQETIFYEIQKSISKKWLAETMKFYEEKNLHFEVIDINKLSDNLKELNKQVKKLIL